MLNIGTPYTGSTVKLSFIFCVIKNKIIKITPILNNNGL